MVEDSAVIEKPLSLKDQIVRDTPNPWLPERWDVADQEKIIRFSREIARRMAEIAGLDLDITNPKR